MTLKFDFTYFFDKKNEKSSYWVEVHSFTNKIFTKINLYCDLLCPSFLHLILFSIKSFLFHHHHFSLHLILSLVYASILSCGFSNVENGDAMWNSWNIRHLWKWTNRLQIEMNDGEMIWGREEAKSHRLPLEKRV